MQIKTKKRAPKRSFLTGRRPVLQRSGLSTQWSYSVAVRRSLLAVAVRGVVRVAAYFPQVGLKGLFATGGVLLLEEGLAILSDLREVFDALVDSCLYLGEASTRCEFPRGDSG